MSDSQAVTQKDLEHIHRGLGEELDCLYGSRILLTGGAGFLGYYLVQYILHANRHRGSRQAIRITVADNYARGVPSWLQALQEDENLRVLKHDVTAPPGKDLGAFEYVIHAASIATPSVYRLHPIATMDANVNGLRNLLEHCLSEQNAQSSLRGFLFFSSSEIYGDPSPDAIPTPETYRGFVSCTGPRACYDESKRYGETLSVNFAQQFDLPIKIVRPFNNFGPGLRITDGRVVPDFARRIMAGEDIELLSDGSPRRTFCYVADAVVGYYKVLVRGKAGEAYNIGVERPEISMADLAKAMQRLGQELVGYRGNVVHRVSADRDYLTDNPIRRCPQITKAVNQVGYQPTIGLEEGLRRSLIWYRDHSQS